MISKGARDSIHLLGRRHQAFQDDAIGYDLTWIFRAVNLIAVLTQHFFGIVLFSKKYVQVD